MSAIVGLYFLDGQPVDRTDLERMVDILVHRGPDGAGLWNEGPVGLGHRMLWTTPESLQEKLPLVNRTCDLVLTADARIDNRDELISTLALSDRPRGEITDSQLILAAYQKWGGRCPEKLLGDFAFVIWDGRKQELFCARDHFGVKPFYYYRSNQLFVCASEIKALLCLPEVPRRLNELMAAHFLHPELAFQDKAITFYQDILRLPPAHSMSVTADGIKSRSYWSLDPERELWLGSDDEYADAFLEVFTKAVRCRVRSAFPVGSTLSGGLDSSSITCVAQDLMFRSGHHKLHTFSAIFDDVPQADESAFIKTVVAQSEVEAHYTHPDQLSPLIDLDRVLWHTDEAFFCPNYFIPWSVYRAAKEQGVRVVLDGTDGDTTVSHGTDYLTVLAGTGQWAAFAFEAEAITKRFDDPRYATRSGILKAYGTKQLTELARRGRWMAFARGVNGIGKHFGVSRRLLLKHGLKPLAPAPVRRAWRMLRGRNGSMSRVSNVVNQEFAERMAIEDRLKALDDAQSRRPQTARSQHLHFLTLGTIPASLELLNKFSAAFFVELRYPFCDRRLVEFCLALPPEQKLRDGWSRLVMRRAMANILPVAVQWRGGKSDLSPVYNRGLKTFERKLLDEVMSDDGGDIQEYLDMATLREAYQRYLFQNGHHDRIWVWNALTLAVWLRNTALRP